MALRIGNVDFGIDARTEGLRNALTKLKSFETQVNRVARAQTEGAQKAAAAMGKQESAIKKAFQQTVNLQKQLKKSGASTSEVSKVSNNFRLLTNQLTKGKISTLEYTRALDAFNARLARSKRALSDLNTKKAEAEGNKLTQTLRNLESASVLAIGPLSGLGARIRSLGAIMNRSTLILTAMVAGFTLLTVAVGKLAFSAVSASIEWERSFSRFKAATPTLANAAKEMLFVIETAQELGLRIDVSAKAYSRLTAASAGTALAGENTRDIFLGISKAAAALRLNNVEVEGTFRAIEQIMSKGSVQAEELRGQLGERLPGAFNRAAAAMGVTTQQLGEMLKKGEVTANEFLPKFTRELEKAFGEAAKGNVASFGGSVNRLSNEWFLFNKQFDDYTKTSIIVISVINKTADALEGVRKHIDLIFKALGAATGVLVGFIAQWAIMAGAGMVASIGALVVRFAMLTKTLALMNITMNAMPIGKVVTGVLKLTAVVGGAVVGWKAMEGVISDVDGVIEGLKKQSEGAIDPLISGLAEVNPKLWEFREQIVMMQKRLRAMQEGPAALEFFERITVPMDQFRKAMVEAGLSMDEARILGADFVKVLKEIVEAEDAITGAANASANAIVNSFEDMIFKSDSLRDSLKNLARELIKIGLRAAIFDPIAKGMGNFFSGMNLPTFASGGNTPNGPMIVGEKGPEIFNPGIKGHITPNDEIGGFGGGGVNITINAPGADQGTIARIREMIASEMVPQIVQQSTRHTLTQLKRPSFS